MKRLKFSEPLPKLILEDEKDTTWRINDEKNITVGDQLSLCRLDGTEFGKAEVLSVKETIFGNLTDEDMKGHERFSSKKEIYETYSKYYNMKVGYKTKFKIIKFRLI